MFNKKVQFRPPTSHHSIFNVQEARGEFYEMRLALVEDRVFSHSGVYERPKLYDAGKNKGADGGGTETVYSLHSIVGKKHRMLVLGFLTQKEDTHYYLEDSTCSIKVTFDKLEYVDPDAFFTESCVLLCQGYHQHE